MNGDDESGGGRTQLGVETLIVEVPIFQRAELDELEAAANAHVATGIRLRSIARRLIRKAQAARARWGSDESVVAESKKRQQMLRVVPDLSELEQHKLRKPGHQEKKSK